MPIAILYYKVSPESINSAQQSAQIADWIEELPIIKQNRIKKLHRQKDRVLSLAGLQLLKIAISEYLGSPFSLDQLQFPEHGKPYFNSNIDFNISHSGDFVCCIASDNFKVGVDIEKPRYVRPAILNKFLPNALTKNKEENQRRFFELWTKNEAIIKASNSGSIHNMKEIKLEDEGGYYQDQFWFTYPIKIMSTEYDKEYTCHIACSKKISADEIMATQIRNL